MGEDGELEVGVVGEKGLAGGSVIAGDDPVVAAERVANVALGFADRMDDCGSKSGSQVDEAGLRAWKSVRRL